MPKNSANMIAVKVKCQRIKKHLVGYYLKLTAINFGFLLSLVL